jgi:1-acyl-sn-glycerol-3-phosphate acyltransferase
MIVQAIRSAVFYVLFIGQTVALAVLLGTISLFLGKGRQASGFVWGVGRYWGNANKVLLRYIVGIKSDVSGGNNIPKGGCIIAAKHQSDWDIFAILPNVPLPAFIAKRELLDMPFFGRAALMLNAISVDRKLGSEAITNMLADAAGKVARGSEVIIFPEGTRRAPGAEPNYRSGVTRMYAALNVPVVPVAVNSGLFWGRNSPILWPGTARARFLPPIPPGLAPEAFQQRLIATIEAASDELALEAYREGLARPIPSALREKLEALRQQAERAT